MNKDETSNTSAALPPASETAERDLDRMLGLLAAPAPSETLRARLLRDFKPGGGESVTDTPEQPERPRSRFGALAMAAALVIGITLGILVRPGSSPTPVATSTPDVPASLVATSLDAPENLLAFFEGRLDLRSDDFLAERNFTEGAPDSAAFMLAALDLALRANDPAPDGAGSFEGIPLE